MVLRDELVNSSNAAQVNSWSGLIFEHRLEGCLRVTCARTALNGGRGVVERSCTRDSTVAVAKRQMVPIVMFQAAPTDSTRLTGPRGPSGALAERVGRPLSGPAGRHMAEPLSGTDFIHAE